MYSSLKHTNSTHYDWFIFICVGLDISDTEGMCIKLVITMILLLTEPEIPSSSDFNIHIKERTLTPRKQEEINGSC